MANPRRAIEEAGEERMVERRSDRDIVTGVVDQEREKRVR